MSNFVFLHAFSCNYDIYANTKEAPFASPHSPSLPALVAGCGNAAFISCISVPPVDVLDRRLTLASLW